MVFCPIMNDIDGKICVQFCREIVIRTNPFHQKFLLLWASVTWWLSVTERLREVLCLVLWLKTISNWINAFYMWVSSYMTRKSNQYILHYFVEIRLQAYAVIEHNGNIYNPLILKFKITINRKWTKMYGNVMSTKSGW